MPTSSRPPRCWQRQSARRWGRCCRSLSAKGWQGRPKGRAARPAARAGWMAAALPAAARHGQVTGRCAMRTTLDIDDDILQAVKELARAEGKTAGKMLSELARRALTQAPLTGFSEEVTPMGIIKKDGFYQLPNRE